MSDPGEDRYSKREWRARLLTDRRSLPSVQRAIEAAELAAAHSAQLLINDGWTIENGKWVDPATSSDADERCRELVETSLALSELSLAASAEACNRIEALGLGIAGCG